jgi:hypothetical protein
MLLPYSCHLRGPIEDRDEAGIESIIAVGSAA